MSILIVGEFMSQLDAEIGKPFSDNLSKMFKAWLSQRGIDFRQCDYTNVINAPSPARGVFGFCGTKAEGLPNRKALLRGKYVKREYGPHIDRLWNRVKETKPNLVLALGDLALWALTSEANLKNSRGRIVSGNSEIPNQKILPTYAPRQIAADWTLRPIHFADLEKANRQSAFPEIVRPQRFIHLYPSLQDLEAFYQEYIVPSPKLDVDIETKGRMITCIGFAPSPERVLVVPFFTESIGDGNYWRLEREELAAWDFVRRMLALPKAVGGQNFQYDMQYLWREMGIPVLGFADDTMLLHHALQPEMQKGLGFLASCYTDELPWKFMHKIAAADRGAKKGDGE